MADRRDATREASSTYPGLAEREAFLKWKDEVWATRLRSVAINCWYLGTVESHAMWRLFGATVALESTVGEVLGAFQGPPIIAGRVTYQEYEDRLSTGLRLSKCCPSSAHALSMNAKSVSFANSIQPSRML